MSFVLPLLAVLVPLLITPGLLFHYDSAPSVIILAIAMAVMVTRPRSVADAVQRLWQQEAGRWLTILAVVQTVWLVLCSALSSHPLFSFYGSNWRRLGVMTILPLIIFVLLAASHFLAKPEQIRFLLRVMAIVTVAASLYGIAQYFDIDPFQPFTAYHAKDGDSTIVRPPGTLGHADYFGWWLSISLFCALATASIETGMWRLAGLSASVICGIAILLSGTRAAMLAAIVGFVCLATLSHYRPRRQHVLAGLLFLAGFGVFVASPLGERVRARVRWSSDESFGGGRPLLWRDSVVMGGSHLAFGFGPETFTAEFPPYQSQELARLKPDFYHESPHNAALDALVSEGLPGLAIFLGWAAMICYTAARCLQRNRALGVFLISAMAASATASLFNVATAATLYATLLVTAMMVGLAGSPRLAATPPAKLDRTPVVFFLSPVFALCLAAFGVVLVNYEFRLERFERASSHKEPASAMTAYASVLRAGLAGAGEDAYCSRRLADACGTATTLISRIECTSVAVQAAVRATRTSDSPPNAWYNLAIFTAGQNDQRNTEKALRTSARLAPNWFKPHWALANLLFMTGRASEATREAERAAILDAGKDPEVAASLQKITEAR
jgi:O-antigen ligase